MTIYNNLKNNLLKARKEKKNDDVILLSTVIGNMDLKAKVVNGMKVVSDEDAISYIKGHLKNLEVMAEHKNSEKVQSEIKFISEYLPKQMSEEDILSVVRSNSFENMGQFMKYMKENYVGLYDGKTATTIFNNRGE